MFMQISKLVIPVLGVCLFLSTAPASALNSRSFVSGLGSDSNACTTSAPCRTFQHAHDMTSAAGEIAVLDTAGYGSLNITKSISIIAPDGIEAGVTVSSGQTGISINTQYSDTVTLRGLTVSGGGVGDTGISFVAGGTMIVKNCIVTGFASHGIYVTAAAPTGDGITAIIVDTVISNNSSYGILFYPNSSGSLSFERLQLLGNANAVSIQGAPSNYIKATGSDSFSAGNELGFDAILTYFTLDNVKAVNNATGIRSRSAIVTLSRSTISGNTVNGYQIDDGGVMTSFGDNRILDTPNTGSLTSRSTQ